MLYLNEQATSKCINKKPSEKGGAKPMARKKGTKKKKG